MLHHPYEQAVHVIKRLGMGQVEVEEQFRRAVFNIMARNQDDHVKNIAFLMDRSGQWSLSPAFDVSCAWNPGGEWTGRHQMSLNGKRDHFTREDILSFASNSGIKRAKAMEILADTTAALEQWLALAFEAGVPERRIRSIQQAFRRDI
ncbi:type II toxin-antitoxin system HipA family toxin [Hyphomonas sp.]|uniref:type II toxin-antitoxin system HipA family toxin n=1 Tax=Hyphomonas sp. TaxID=87 RepID=UPI0035666CD7